MEVPVFVSASQILARLLTVDANDSGLNANTLQGYVATDFALASALSGYQPLDAELTAIAGLTSAANTVPSFTGSGTAALLTVGTGANNLVQLTAASKLPAVDGSLLTNLPSGGSPGGSNTYIQFNDSSAFGGDSGLTYNKTTDALTVAGTVAAAGLITSKIYPPSNSTTALGWYAANGTTQYGAFDSTNGRWIFGAATAPTGRLDVVGFSDTTTDNILACYSNNLTQGFAIRYDGLYGVGSGTNVDVKLVPKANGNIVLQNGGGYTWVTSTSGIRLNGSGSSFNIYKAATLNIGSSAGLVFSATASLTDIITINGTTGYVGLLQASPTAMLDLPASTAAHASLRARTGVQPASPNTGDLWTESDGWHTYFGGVEYILDMTPA